LAAGTAHRLRLLQQLFSIGYDVNVSLNATSFALVLALFSSFDQIFERNALA
jgi:hypothetical protein